MVDPPAGFDYVSEARGLGYRLTANLVQKFAKKYLKLGEDVTFQAASFSRLITVDRCQRQKRDPD